MAKVIILLSALCALAVANFAVADFEIFDVEGKVFCDTCRLGFVTSLSNTLEGATVRLTCKDMETHNETFTTEGKTDYTGKYTLTVEVKMWGCTTLFVLLTHYSSKRTNLSMVAENLLTRWSLLIS
ncbi:hypothetical protein RDI58_018863 [Solanum bulbocastanum]|uniref:Uncharacterized protein n=1 Tax=Solanum bulbocastanum TaxID=147425 RepID=A0AAN8TIV0_SOLBU